MQLAMQPRRDQSSSLLLLSLLLPSPPSCRPYVGGGGFKGTLAPSRCHDSTGPGSWDPLCFEISSGADEFQFVSLRSLDSGWVLWGVGGGEHGMDVFGGLLRLQICRMLGGEAVLGFLGAFEREM